MFDGVAGCHRQVGDESLSSNPHQVVQKQQSTMTTQLIETSDIFYLMMIICFRKVGKVFHKHGICSQLEHI